MTRDSQYLGIDPALDGSEEQRKKRKGGEKIQSGTYICNECHFQGGRCLVKFLDGMPQARNASRGSTANRKLYESRCPNSYEMVRCEAIRAPNLNLVFSQQPSHLVPSASPQSSSAKECCASKSVRTSRVIR